MWNIIKKYRLAFPFIYLLFLIACDNDKASVNSDKTIEIVNYNSSGFSCRMEKFYNTEYNRDRIHICQILLSDSIALFRGKTNFGQCQVTLTKPIADYIKSLLYDIYTKNKSGVKDQYINEPHAITTFISDWNITMNLEGRKINETIDEIGYSITFDEPFHSQFKRLLELIYAITVKMEQDIFEVEYIHNRYKPVEWIIEKFNDEFYEPYNDIKSIN